MQSKPLATLPVSSRQQPDMRYGSERQIFRRGSTTFYRSSLFFPAKIRTDVFDLYSFVRVADDYVDKLPRNREAFYELRGLWTQSIKSTHFSTAKKPSDSLNQRVIKNMVRLMRAHNFDPTWVESFLDSMESDLSWATSKIGAKTGKKHIEHGKHQFYKFDNPKALLFYIHGSAEVVGLMLARIMGLPKAADRYAELLGRSLQSINFIRDIQEDNNLGRCYFVNSDFEKFGLPDLSEASARGNPEGFANFIREQIELYRKTQREAIKGFRFIPRRYRLPIQTAVDMYDWTANKIAQDPLIVFQKKVKPSKPRILKTALNNIIKT